MSIFASKLPFLVFLRQDEPSPPRPEAYPIPTQTYPRDYFTIPASKSQDRVIGPGQGPSQHWQGMEDRERLPVVDNIHNSMQVRGAGSSGQVDGFCPSQSGQRVQRVLLCSPQRVNHSQEDLYPPAGGMRPEDLMQQHYQQDYQHRELDYQNRDLDYQRGLPGRTARKSPDSVEFETEKPRSISGIKNLTQGTEF